MKTASLATTLAGLAVGTCLATAAAAQEKVLRIGMTAADIPRTLGQPDQGFEGNRFTGIPIYDALTQWDLSEGEGAVRRHPGRRDRVEGRRRRQDQMGVQAPPGREIPRRLDAQRRRHRLERPEGARQGGAAFRPEPGRRHRVAHADAAHGAQDRRPDGRAHDQRARRLPADQPDEPVHGLAGPLGSEAQGRAGLGHRPGRAREAGLGRLRRRPLRLRPVPDDALRAARAARAAPRSRTIGTRSAARRSTRSCCCRCPRPTPAPRRCSRARSTGSRRRRPTPCRRSSSRGFVLYQNAQPHVWPWQLSFAEGSPWLDKRVRHAANLCVNRDELKELLGGMMAEATGTYEPGHPWWGNPKFEIKYDPAARQEADAGGRLLGRKAAQGEGADLGLGLRPDAADPDERVHAAGAEGVLLRRRARRDRVEHAVHQLAPRAPRTSRRAARTPST